MNMAVVVAEPQNVERVGTVERKAFTIQASAEAFRILSDGLYSDKVTAVLRELGTNAIDAHVEASNPSSFLVHLPTSEQPWFNIRDFGTGLSHDEVMNLYSTYFGTNKLDNPNAVGQLGLGSKSPLAYTRSFSVTSFVNGQKNHYVITLDEERIPQVNYLPNQSGPTTEPNGLEVQIAVRYSDFSEFRTKAANVYRYFTIKPQITNIHDFKLPKPDILVQGNGWRIYSGAGTAKAVMGSIAYPIHSDKIHEITPHQRQILACNIEIDFQIGDLQFTPSRETLAYQKRTSETLRLRLDKIVEEVNTEVAKKFDNAQSLWEARVLAYSLFWDTKSTLSHFQKLADTTKLQYKGKPIAGQQLHFDKEGIEAYSFAKTSRSRYGRKYSYNNPDDTESICIKRSKRQYFTPKTNIMWCEVDLPRGSYVRCQDVVASGKADEVYLVSFATPECKAKFCEHMGLIGNEFVKTSTLPKSAVRRGIYHKSGSRVFKHTGSKNEYRFYKYWKEADVELDDGGVYVEMKHNQAFVDNHTVNPAQIGTIIEKLKLLGYNIDVIGVKPDVAKDFRKSDDWVDIYTYLRNLLKVETAKNNLGKNIANNKGYNELVYNIILETLHKQCNVMTVLDNSPFKLFLTKMATFKPLTIKNDAVWCELADYVGFSLKSMADCNLSEDYECIAKMYPMLAMIIPHLSRYGIDSRVLFQISDYVNLVDEKNGLTVSQTVL
jgi:hypothetical protein